MLESLVASILNRVVGSYVENFDPNQLQIGLLGGDVKLHGLKLKKGALDQLKLPLNVVSGHIGSLVLQIPYSNLKSKPVKVFVEDVFLIAKPDMAQETEGQKRRDQVSKLDKLQLWELTSERAVSKTSNAREDSTPEAAQQQNFTSSLVTKIIENLQVTIRNIHLRFEDMDVGVAMGATLGELSALSTNADWEPAFIANVETKTHKLATLDSLAFYIDPEVSTDFSSASQSQDQALKEQFLNDFKAMIFDSVGATDLLRPINGQGFITMNKKPTSKSEPKIKADLKFEELSVNLDREQYVDMLKLTERFQNYFNNLRYRRNRPKVTVKEDPLAWFRYAAKTVYDGIHERNRVWTWEAINQRLKDQKAYITMYKKWYQQGGNDQGFTPTEKTEFAELQEQYTYSDLVFFRSLAKQELLNENGSLENARKPQQSQQSWSQWLWGSKPDNQAVTAGPDQSKPLEITEKDRLELLDVLDEPSLSQDASDQTLVEVEFSLRSAGMRLKAGDISLASAGFEGVSATFINKPDSFSYEMGLAKFNVSDLTHQNQFSELITIQKHSQPAEGEPEDFLWLYFEHHPANKIADSNLFLKSKSLVIVHNARLIESVIKFFAVPPDQGETVDAILSAANKTVEELREQTRLGLEYALEHHKTLNLQLDIKAPTIILPLDASDSDSAALVLDVGSLGMASDLVPQNVLEEVKSKQALKYTKDDWKRLESLMYDRFTIKLKDTQILLGNKISEIEEARNKDSSQYHFLDKTTLQFLLEISIVPNNASLTRSRVSINLPSLRATLSDAQYLLFMKIVNSATPRGDVDADSSTQIKDDDKNGTETNTYGTKAIDDVENNPEDDEEKLQDFISASAKSDEAKTNTEAVKAKGTSQPQRIFELVFVVNEVHFFIVKGWKGTPLIDMCLHDFNVKFWTSNNVPDEAMAVDVTVRDLLINDHVDADSPAELRKIAESVGHAENSKSEYNLFTVQYRKSHAGEMVVNTNLEAIRFTLNPTSVLEVYDYIMSTFAQPQPNTGTVVSEQTPEENKSSENEPQQPQSNDTEQPPRSKINVNVNMSGVSAVLVDNHKQVALLAMEKTTINVVLEEAMKMQMTLGSVSMKDGLNKDVLSIEKDGDLVDFRYETKPLDENMKPTGPALVYLRMGKVNVAIMEGSLTQIMGFLTKFTAMKSAYDQARMMAFNQAIQVEPGMFLFDIVISSPIVNWNCEDDWIRLNLGELFVRNQFNGTINDLKAGIQHAQLTSSIHGVEKEIIPETAFGIGLVHTPDAPKGDKDTPLIAVKSNLSPIHIRSSEHQYKLVMLFLASLSKISEGAANAGMADEEVGKLRRQLAKEKQIGDQEASYWWGENFSLALGAAESVANAEAVAASKRPKLMLEFEAPSFDITLDMDEKPLSRMSIQEIATEVEVGGNGTEINFHIRSFTAEDLGNTEKNKFPQIIPPIKHDGYQLMGRILQQKDKPLDVDCSVDSPQVIVALEYMLRLKSFAQYGVLESENDSESDMSTDIGSEIYDDDYDSDSSVIEYGSANEPEDPNQQNQKLQESLVKPKVSPNIRIDIVDMYLTVLADESNESSEAVVFKIEQLKYNTNSAPTIEVSKIGMYLMRMHLPEDHKLRILDDFTITCWFDNSESTEQLRLANARVKVDPLVLRLSLREIYLISSIAAKASEIYSIDKASQEENSDQVAKFGSGGRRGSKKSATRFFADDYRVANRDRNEGADYLRHTSDADFYNEADDEFEVTRILSEQLTIDLDGFRLVLIDPVHQLPLTDFCVKPFTLEAKNWSDSLVAEGKAELFANVNSFAKSAWEPLIDTMELGLSVTSESVTVYSDSTANFELTSETVELWNDIKSYFDTISSESALTPQRDDAAPYRIRNETGMSITVFNDTKSAHGNKRKHIENNEEVKWAFHDWRELRENLNVVEKKICLGIEFEDNYYDPLQEIAVNRVGEHVSVLKHGNRKDRLIVDIWIDNHLKYVVIKSSFAVQNHTESTLEVKAVPMNTLEHTPSSSLTDQADVLILPPNCSRSLPLKNVDSRIFVRKQGDLNWSSEGLYWRDLIGEEKNTSRTIRCKDDFLLEAIAERPNAPVSKVYPYLTINLAAPFQIINNLPRDVMLRLYCRTTRQESHFPLENAGRAYLHNYSDEALLLLRVDLDGYRCNKFAVINTGKKYSREFHTENVLEVSQNNQVLQLSLEYVDLPNGMGRAIVVYSPYLIMNNTNLDLVISNHANRSICSSGSTALWSFNQGASRSSEKVTLACRDSHVSHPISLEASGTNAEVKILSRDKQRELYLGVSISPGIGRYVNTKKVSVCPRFIICNQLKRPVLLHELGGNKDMRVEPDEQAPVGFIFGSANKEMCLRFGDSDGAQWSSSFIMANVGTVAVRAAEVGKPTVLVRVEVILEQATLFVSLSPAKSWPYSLRNFTDDEYIFYQTDPYADEDGEYSGGEQSDFKPITYRLPPRSAMPYSWDFPAASAKQIILEPAAPKQPEVPELPPAKPQRPPPVPSRPSAASSSAASILSRNTTRSERAQSIATTATSTAGRSTMRGATNAYNAIRDHRTIKRRKIHLADIGELPPAHFGKHSIVDLSVIADGPQLALVISPHNSEASHYDARTNKVKTEAINEMEEIDQTTGRTYHLNLKGIGISCVTNEAQELFYVTLHNIKVGFNISEAMETLSTEIQWIQVDNSLPGTSDFPVIMYPTVLPKAAEELAAHPCFSASLTRMRDDSYGVAYIKHATLLLQEMSIEVDEDFLVGLVKLAISLSQKTGPVGSKNVTYIPLLDNDSILGAGELHAPRPTGDSTPDIYFEQLHLQPMQLNLSFVRTGSLSTTDVFKDNSAAGSLALIIDALTLTIGNVNVAPLRFNALLVDNVRTHLNNLLTMVQVHYQQEFIYQLHKVLGSADIIGNPVGLFNNISSGVMDLFYEPYLGYTLQDRPSEFGVGLAKGGLSFMKKSVFGISDSISKVTGSLSKGLTAMTLDDRYQNEQRSRRSRNRPKHAAYGVKYGFESFYDSFSSGVMGLAEQPMQGALTNGGSGFFKGLGVGLLGLPTKTTVGLLDFASNVTEGIRNTTTVFDEHSVSRVRLPRVISLDGVVRPYNARESVGQMILHTVRDGRYSHDHYLAHSNITKNKVVVVSLERVMLASISDSSLEWSLSYNQVESIAMERSGIVVTLRGGAHGPFIPLSDPTSRQYIYENIGKAVSEYEHKRIALN